MALLTLLQLFALFGCTALLLLASAWVYDRLEALWLEKEKHSETAKVNWHTQNYNDWQTFPPPPEPPASFMVSEKVIVFKTAPQDVDEAQLPKAA